MKYVSTRGGIFPIPFKEAVMMGLATDGGLIIPETIPKVDDNTLRRWEKLDYASLAAEVISIFSGDIKKDELLGLLQDAYRTFDIKTVVEIRSFGSLSIMELFHGPTLSFKDIALQFLGNLFEYILSERGETLNILGATSGDTGSAAIYGVKGRRGMSIFILYPHGRVSPIQEIQMTTTGDPNVHCIAIEGTFDDCQSIVKEIFSDIPFKERYNLGAVNSINWSRVVAQVVYYIWGYLRMREEGKSSIRFTVPTGNFGNIFAGFLAKKMLPEGCIERLILATNENDILHRFVSRGDYSIGKVIPTISPSMDIQVASNFERYLYILWEGNTEKVRSAMDQLKKEGKISFSEEDLEKVKGDFLSSSVTQEETLETIRSFYRRNGYILDPHTAVGVRTTERYLDDGIHTVCLATAHPAKFPEAVEKATGVKPEAPPRLKELIKKEKRFTVLPASTERVREYIEEKAIR